MFFQGEFFENDIKFNIYVVIYIYGGLVIYVISFEDLNCNVGILNVNFFNLVSIFFYVENVFMFFNLVFLGCNNFFVLQVLFIDFVCIDEIFIYNFGVFDIDGDSLVYELVVF